MKPREIAALRQRGSAGYSAPTRQAVTYTTGLLDPGDDELGRIALAISYRLLAIDTSTDARVRLYVSPDLQTLDLSRAIGTDPLDGSGVQFEYVSAPDIYAVTLSPLVDGTSSESPPNARIPITITNTGDSATAITVTLTFLQTE